MRKKPLMKGKHFCWKCGIGLRRRERLHSGNTCPTCLHNLNQDEVDRVAPPDRTADRVIYTVRSGDVHCVEAKGLLSLPVECTDALKALGDDIALAFECRNIFGGIPLPVAKTILGKLEPMHGSLLMATLKATGKELR